MIWKIFWEFPLTASFVVFITLFYFGVIFFVPTDTIRHYFLSYPGRFTPVNWLLSIFFHGSPGHLFSNMVFLFFLGRVVEAKVEKGKWLLFYFMAGFISAFLDSIIRGFILSGQSELPVVGASGAISGLAAVSALLSPFKIRINHKNFYFPVFIVSWIMVYSDFTDLFSSDHIAHWSHLAGFFSVFIAAYFLNSSDRVKIRNGFFLNLVFFSLTVILLYFIYER